MQKGILVVLFSLLQNKNLQVLKANDCVLSPEVFESTYGPKADVWSAGCVAHQMFAHMHGVVHELCAIMNLCASALWSVLALSFVGDGNGVG